MTISKLISGTLTNQGTKFWKIVFIMVGLVLLYLTLMPSISVNSHYRHIDKVFHFIGFGAFAFAFSVAYPKIKYYLIILMTSVLGALVEILQSFIPHRAFSYWDMLADFLGILFAILLLSLLRYLLNKLVRQ